MLAAALFADRHSTHAAAEQLVQAGFARNEVSVAMSDETYEREFGAGGGRLSSSGSGPSTGSSGVLRTPNPGGVLIAIVAGVKPIELAAGASLRVAGPLFDPLQRSRDVSVALAELGTDAGEARFLRDGLTGGQIVVGVHATDDRAELARQLLQLSGGEATKAA
jgi:hypothetical protein